MVLENLWKERKLIYINITGLVGYMNCLCVCKYTIAKYNGRGKYDGHTLNPTEIIKPKYNGQYKHDGTMPYRGKQMLPAESYVRIPFKYRTGIRDVITANIPYSFTDYAQSQTKYNSAAKYNRMKKYSGFGDNSFYELLKMTEGLEFLDDEAAAENLSVEIIKPLDEHFTTHNRYDGYSKHNGQTKYRAAKETFSARGEGADVTDAVNMAEAFLAGKRLRHKFDGTYHYDGEILYNGNVLIPV